MAVENEPGKPTAGCDADEPDNSMLAAAAVVEAMADAEIGSGWL